MRVRIYQPTKSSMQSGQSRSDHWILEFPRNDRATPDMLMGWQSSSETAHTIHMAFPSKEEAIAYADKYSLDYHVIKTGNRHARLQGYADNFTPGRRQAWTH
jgi:hypothetical protein